MILSFYKPCREAYKQGKRRAWVKRGYSASLSQEVLNFPPTFELLILITTEALYSLTTATSNVSLPPVAPRALVALKAY
eukprot:1150576-Pelagomonas_calceolata.AAC.2